MPISVNITGGLTSPYAARLIGNVAREAYDSLAKDVLLPSLERDLPGHYKHTVKKKFTGVGLNTQMVLYSNAPGIKQIEEGRPAGGNTPIRVLLKFVKKHGLGANAMRISDRRPLAVGIRRIRNRKTGKLRSHAQSLLAVQMGIAFAIRTMIKREGLPRNTGFPPSHELYLFRDIKKKHAAKINFRIGKMQEKFAQVLNA